jgi:molybdenum cofactor sulfurtransferase
LGLSNEDIKNNFNSGHVCWDDHDIINGKPTGAIRVSPPYFATHSDIDKFVDFVETFFVEKIAAKKDESSGAKSSETAATAKLTKVIVYPIKSCAGFEVDVWQICEEGLLHDREWTLVDTEGNYINQRRVRDSKKKNSLFFFGGNVYLTV